jgi:O-succinylbenzoic acid--CoA ligase
MKIHLFTNTYTKEDIVAITSFSNSYADKIIEFCKKWFVAKENIFELQTSGSTGIPKTIAITRQQMQASAEMTAQKLQLGAGTKALLCLQAEYIGGKMMLVRAMHKDWELFVVSPTNLPFANIDTTIKLDFVALVPTQLQQTLELMPEKIALLNQMQAIIVGGAAISVSLEKLIQKHLTVPVYSTYGMTETISHIALKQINPIQNNFSNTTYFSLLPNIEVDVDIRNCLKIKGLVTNNLWIQSNDLVKLEYDRNRNIVGFSYLGRVDNVINSGGVKIQVEKVEQQIEEILCNLGMQNRLLLLGIPDNFWGEKLVLLIEDSAWNQEKIDFIMAKMATKIAKYEIPKEIYFFEKFIETPTAKINRKENYKRIIAKLY